MENHEIAAALRKLQKDVDAIKQAIQALSSLVQTLKR